MTEKMTAKQYLSQLKRLDKMIDNELYEIYKLRTLSAGISAAVGGDRVQTSGSFDKMGDSVSKLVDKEREMQRHVDLYMEFKEKIKKQIESIENDTFYNILHARYIKLYTFEKIAEDTKYSVRQARRIHDSALIEFENMFKNEMISIDVIECHV